MPRVGRTGGGAARPLTVMAAVIALIAVAPRTDATAPSSSFSAAVARPEFGAGREVSLILVGDSLTAFNVSTLEQALHAAPVPTWRVDAHTGRRAADDQTVGSGILRSGRWEIARMVADGWSAPTWLIELGTNDLLAIEHCGCDMVAAAATRIAAVRAAVPAAARVVWITPRHGGAPRAGLAWRTAALDRGRRDRSFTVVDWFARSRFQPAWFLDGIHPNARGVRELRDLVAGHLLGLLPSTVVPATTVPPPTVVPVPPASSVGGVGASADRVATRLQTPRVVRGGPTTAQRCGSIAGPVRAGSSAAAVRAVQCALVLRGFDPGGVTGVYGPSTAAAVWALQRRQALPRTGVVDERTGHALGVWNYP